jgi:hypothetical protein
MNANKYTSTLNELQSLLEMQLKLVREGNSAGKQMNDLGTQTDLLVEEIVQAGILERPEFKSQKEKLKKTYEELHLAITAQKANTAEKLSRVRRGRKIVGTYRGNNRL